MPIPPRPFAYNTGTGITGTDQVGSLAIGVGPQTSPGPGGLKWWSGPNEGLGYVIAYPQPSGDHPTPIGPTASLGFFRSTSLSEGTFLSLANYISNGATGPFYSGDQAKTWLNANGYWTSWGQVPSGMVLYLDASNSSSYGGTGSTWYDLSGNGNNGTLNNVTFSSSGADTMVFNGTSSYVSFSSTSNIPIENQPYAISVWFNADSMVGAYGLVGWGSYGNGNQVNAFRVLGTNGLVNYWWGNDLSVYPVGLAGGSWFNAIAQYDGTTRSIWLNGATAASDTPGAHSVPSSSNLTIGNTNTTEYFPGDIAEVLIYDRALSFDEIQAIYNSGKPKYIPSGLVVLLDAAYYSGSGTTWTDLSGNGNNATLINSPTYSTASRGMFSFLDTSFQYASIPNIGNLSQWTIEAWFRPTASLTGKISSVVTNQFDLVNKLNYSLGTNNAPTSYNLCAGFFDGVGSGWHNTTGIATTANTWYQVVGTYDGTTIRQYVNGSASGGTLTYSGTPQSGGEVRIMRRWDSPNNDSTNFLKGDVSIVRIYNRALSAEEVLSNYEGSRSRFAI